jgi:2-polyprenyl-3-methyl-5-hydroxy-6-metoxy-1,4-benzoquinol methylase/Tfp pilus assembly protein PilF
MNRKERRAAQKRGPGGAGVLGVPGGSARIGSLPPTQAAQMFVQAGRHRLNGEIEEADRLCRTILATYPEHAGSLHIRGSIALQLGRPDLAADMIGKAIASRDDIAAYHDDLGIALHALGRTGEAIAHHRRAISLEPDSARSYNNLAVRLMEQGQLAEAAEQFARALVLTPELLETYADVSATLFTLNPALQAAVARAEAAWPRRLSLEELFGPAGFEAVSGDPLLQRVLVSAQVRDIALERLLTSVRLALLKSATHATAEVGADESVLSFCCALARQCFINEYVFATTPEELEAAERLKQSLVAALEAKSAIPPLWLAAIGSYEALGALPNAPAMLDNLWPAAVDELLTQQLREPAEERRIRETIARLTPIEDATSLLVKQQYEENPYPRWVLLSSKQAHVSVEEYLNRKFPGVPLLGRANSDGVDILIAGCGTGRHPILVAQMYKGARVLAVDLSLASLAYAARETRRSGIGNITYAQADILKLGSLGRTFDVVDASGVLHHLADPMAGLHALGALVRPNGFMHIGLYSELARRDIVAARTYCAEHGYRPSAQDIRAARHELVSTEFKSLARVNDFYSTSECRDLLFHVQEHRFTIAQIRAFLAEHDLRFIGFDLANAVYAAYCQRFPDDPAMRDLEHWHTFESEQPATFVAMYQFWVQKR